MKVQSIRIEQLRQFRQPLEIRDLGPGINLFVGPNESGKSTLVRAIRAAFFERYKSSSVEDLRPWGDSAAAPEVAIEFEWQGEHWRLNKRFLRQKRCDLQIGGRACSGEEAEDQLSTLLGYEFAGSGASKPKHWGIPGLLWVEQGQGQEIDDAVDSAEAHLQSALGGNVSELTSSIGDAVFERVREERNKLRTASTDKPTGELAKAIKHVADLESHHAELLDKVDSYRSLVDRLGDLLVAQKQDDSKPWLTFRADAKAARQQLDAIKALQSEQDRENRELQQNEESQRLCSESLQYGSQRQALLAERQRELSTATQALADKQALEPSLLKRLQQAQSQSQAAGEQLRLARLQEQRCERQAALQLLKASLHDAKQKLEQAKSETASLLQQRAQLASLVVEPATLKQLKALAQELDRLQILEQTAATKLRYQFEAGQVAQLNGVAIEGASEQLLSALGILEIEGVGRLEIYPGGTDLAVTAERKRQCEQERLALLDRLGVVDLQQAEDNAVLAQRLEGEIGSLQKAIAQLAPDGIDALAQTVQSLRERTEYGRSQLDQMPAASDSDITVDLAQEQLSDAAERLSDLESALADQRREVALLAQQVEHLAGECKRLQREADDPANRDREQQLLQQLGMLKIEQRRLEQSLQQRSQEINSARPDILEQDIKRLELSADAAEQSSRQRDREIQDLRVRLEVMGAEGLEEQSAEVQTTLQAARGRLDELERRADALSLLQRLLQEKRQELTQRLQAPLQKHLNHYLQLLFPQASLVVDEHLKPVQLARGSRADAFHEALGALSFGAREQMGLISRLAYADMLKEAGKPTLIILDDALVHSDSQRLAQMKRVLFDAAQRHQILLFSCHPENWQDLGIRQREMNGLRVDGAP